MIEEHTQARVRPPLAATWSWERALFALSVVAFALVSAAFVNSPAIPVTLYANMTGTPYHDNVPNIPVIPLVGGVALGIVAALPNRPGLRDGLRGLTVGVAAVLYIGLMKAVELTFQDPYFTLPYRIYGVAFLTLATLLVAFFAWRIVRGDVPIARPHLLGWALVCVIGAASLSAIAARDIAPGVVALVAGGVGVYVAERRLIRVPAISERAALISLVAVTLGFRSIFGLQALLRTGPGAAFAAASDDGPQYFDHASAIYADLGAITKVLAANDGFPPAYSVFLAATLAVGNGSLGVAVVAQAILAAVGAALLYILARRIGGSAVAFVATVLYATEQNMIQIQSTLTPEALLIPTALLAMWALVRYRDTRSSRWMAIAATAMAFAFVSRNNVGVALIVASVLWLGIFMRDRIRTARDMLIIAAAFVVFVTPIALATVQIDGKPRITNQLAGVGYEIDGRGDGITVENGFLIARGINPFKDPIGSLERIVADPIPVIGFLATAAPQRLSTLLFFIPSGVSDPRNIVAPAQFPNPYGQALDLILVAALVVAVVMVVARRSWRRPETALLLAYTVLYVSMFLFIFPPRHSFRYRIPIEPVLFIAQGAGVLVIASVISRLWSAPGRTRRAVPELFGLGHGKEHAVPAVDVRQTPATRGKL